MPLFNGGPHPTGRRIRSTVANLYAELLRVREEAQSAVIRVGELAILASELVSLPPEESHAALGDLSPDDLQLWRLIHRRNGEPLVIEFEDGLVNLSLPTLAAHIPEEDVRTIKFRVHNSNKRQAKLIAIKEVADDMAVARHSIACPRKMKLLRSPASDAQQQDVWFLLYVAEYRNLVVEAMVRMALKQVDRSASHLELIKIVNHQELTAEMAQLMRLP